MPLQAAAAAGKTSPGASAPLHPLAPLSPAGKAQAPAVASPGSPGPAAGGGQQRGR